MEQLLTQTQINIRMNLEKSGRFIQNIILAAFLIILLSPQMAHAYPDVKIKNNSHYTVTGRVDYEGPNFICGDDDFRVGPNSTWSHSRGECLIQAIYGHKMTGVPPSLKKSTKKTYGEKLTIVPYKSEPIATSYSGFRIEPFGGSYRIFSEAEYKKANKKTQAKSPGFFFVNKTAWPVAYSLDQVGCLYYGIVPTGPEGVGGRRRVDTGAVWFSLRAHIQPDGINPQTDWTCIKPVAKLVGEVALAAVSGGSAAAAKAGGKLVIKQVIKAAIKKGVKKAAKKIRKRLIKNILKEELGQLLTGSGSVVLHGQYAGYEWPFRCDEMPEYHITGGPETLIDENGDKYLGQNAPFTVTKVNDCGDSMMAGSPKSRRASKSIFATYTDAFGGSNAKASNSPENLTVWFNNYKVGDEIEVYNKNTAQWKAGKITSIDYNKGYFIRYTNNSPSGYADSKFLRYNKFLNVTYQIGEIVEAKNTGSKSWSLAKVLSNKTENGILLSFLNSNSSLKYWTPGNLIRKGSGAITPVVSVSKWKAGDQVEVKRPGTNQWIASQIKEVEASNNILIVYQDNAKKMWVPEAIIRARQNNSPAPVTSQWKVGDQVEALISGTNQWTAAQVMQTDPVNGVLIMYLDNSQQMWMPENDVRTMQNPIVQANPAPVSSNWNTGDQVEVIDSSTGQWFAAQVIESDPRDGVLIMYLDNSQQMWVPEFDVRVSQGNQDPNQGYQGQGYQGQGYQGQGYQGQGYQGQGYQGQGYQGQ